MISNLPPPAPEPLSARAELEARVVSAILADGDLVVAAIERDARERVRDGLAALRDSPSGEYATHSADQLAEVLRDLPEALAYLMAGRPA